MAKLNKDEVHNILSGTAKLNPRDKYEADLKAQGKEHQKDKEPEDIKEFTPTSESDVAGVTGAFNTPSGNDSTGESTSDASESDESGAPNLADEVALLRAELELARAERERDSRELRSKYDRALGEANYWKTKVNTNVDNSVFDEQREPADTNAGNYRVNTPASDPYVIELAKKQAEQNFIMANTEFEGLKDEAFKGFVVKRAQEVQSRLANASAKEVAEIVANALDLAKSDYVIEKRKAEIEAARANKASLVQKVDKRAGAMRSTQSGTSAKTGKKVYNSIKDVPTEELEKELRRQLGGRPTQGKHLR